MSLYFPEPYHDEILYSIISRYHFYMGNTNSKNTLKELFGTENIIPTVELPCNLSKVCKFINNNIYNESYFIKNHTCLPFYFPFLNSNNQISLPEAMAKKNGRSIYAKIGITAGGICTKKDFYYCPECVKEDLDKLGEAYFHRVHQVPGVLVCPIHSCLINRYIITKNDVGRINLIRINLKYIDFTTKYDTNSNLIKIAKSASYILNSDLYEFNQSIITEKYKYMLDNLGLLTPKKRVRQNRLKEMFKSRYSEEFLEMLDSKIDDRESNWLRGIVRKPEKMVHPIRHILFILFLCNDVEEFFKRNKCERYNFENTVWACLNPVASHYKKLVINKCIITSDYKTRQPVGTFKCEICGFTYSRKLNYKDNIYKIGRIKAYGNVWEARLLELLDNEKHSLTGLAKTMKCDPKTIVKYARKLGKGDIINSKIKIPSNKPLNKVENYRDIYAKDILKLINRYPDYTRSEIRKELKKQYAWFYRNDRQWLDKNLPAKLMQVGKCFITNSRVDWAKRDYQTYVKIKSIYITILRKSNKVRITKSVIGNRCGISALLEYHLDKLPITKAYLSKIVETIQEFQIRRIKKACRALIKKNIEIRKWKVMRLAGLKPTCSENIIRTIQFYEQF
ncbi:TnsD family Tn7-like transposition protein [Clostridium cibarium]|uniref:TnsD family transposase n=1 Tax=Clostridium cibarium TaxID=2762247 RepID=A0ABR8PUX6_9CLOT|nr:TnsD family Tn7-like transposition protein [Clostridium cibarium]MBD7911969.1 TnsD family transposase [Clostridium cibarium]